MNECHEKTKSETKNVCVRGESDRFKRAAKQSHCLQTYRQKNHEDKTEKRLWEFGKGLNFNESKLISSIVFRMVLIASGLSVPTTNLVGGYMKERVGSRQRSLLPLIFLSP